MAHFSCCFGVVVFCLWLRLQDNKQCRPISKKKHTPVDGVETTRNSVFLSVFVPELGIADVTFQKKSLKLQC